MTKQGQTTKSEAKALHRWPARRSDLISHTMELALQALFMKKGDYAWGLFSVNWPEHVSPSTKEDSPWLL